MTDLIRIRGLRVEARVGVTEEERSEPRALTIDVDLAVDAEEAGATDELEHTVDYSDIAKRIELVLQRGEIKLLEHAAKRIVDEISPILGVKGVTVEVAKRAPMPQEHDRVSVRMERS